MCIVDELLLAKIMGDLLWLHCIFCTNIITLFIHGCSAITASQMHRDVKALMKDLGSATHLTG